MEVVGFHPTSRRTDLVGGHALNELPRRQTSAVRSRLLKKIEKTTLAARCGMSAMLKVIRRPEPFRCRVVAPVEQGFDIVASLAHRSGRGFLRKRICAHGISWGAELVPQHRPKLGTLSAGVWSASESPGAVHRVGDRDLVLAFPGMDQIIANLSKYAPQLRAPPRLYFRPSGVVVG